MRRGGLSQNVAEPHEKLVLAWMFFRIWICNATILQTGEVGMLAKLKELRTVLAAEMSETA